MLVLRVRNFALYRLFREKKRILHHISTLAWHAYRVGRNLITGRDLQVAHFLPRQHDTSKCNFEPNFKLALLIFNNYVPTHVHVRVSLSAVSTSFLSYASYSLIVFSARLHPSVRFSSNLFDPLGPWRPV